MDVAAPKGKDEAEQWKAYFKQLREARANTNLQQQQNVHRTCNTHANKHEHPWKAHINQASDPTPLSVTLTSLRLVIPDEC